MYGVSLPRLVGALGPLAAVGHLPVVALVSQGGSVVPIMGAGRADGGLAGAASIALTGIVALPPATTAAATSAPSDLAPSSTQACAGVAPTLDARWRRLEIR